MKKSTKVILAVLLAVGIVFNYLNAGYSIEHGLFIAISAVLAIGIGGRVVGDTIRDWSRRKEQ